MDEADEGVDGCDGGGFFIGDVDVEFAFDGHDNGN